MIFKMNNHQGPTGQHVDLCSGSCGSLDGRAVWGERIPACVWLRPFAAHLKLPQCSLLISYGGAGDG